MENDTKLRMSPAWFGAVVLITVLQVGFTGSVIFFVLNEFTVGRMQNPLALLNVGAILAVDAFIVYWLVRLAAIWEPSDEDE